MTALAPCRFRRCCCARCIWWRGGSTETATKVPPPIIEKERDPHHMAHSRRDRITRVEGRQGVMARGPSPTRHESHLTPVNLTKPYVYGASDPKARPSVPQGERADRLSPELAGLARAAMQVRQLQVSDCLLTRAELLPGLWVQQQVTGVNGAFLFTRTGLLAENRTVPHGLVLWHWKDWCRVADSAYVLGPSQARDESMPLFETRPVDLGSVASDIRELLQQYARQGVFNQTTRRWELGT
ncbi:hypothetical protein ACIQVK_18705 [Streptomyces sp. NPDC090493]|uniref:hypothetical protein n=1 Tax=Streptomyces sp. NPDC090493 TaxID=3365964 RepID=UPI0037F97E6A